MQKPVVLNIHGIKCDYCPYKAMEVPREDYEVWVNKSCPDCGENLLTEEHYQEVLKIEGQAEKINKLFDSLPNFLKKLFLRDDGKSIKIPLIMDEDGETIMDLDEASEVNQDHGLGD